jgi:hypothetical protein
LPLVSYARESSPIFLNSISYGTNIGKDWVSAL